MCRSPRNSCYRFFVILILMVVFSGCGYLQRKPEISPSTSLKKLRLSSYPDFKDHHHYKGLIHSINQSLSYLNRVPRERTFIYGQDVYTAGHLIDSLNRISDIIVEKPSEKELNRFIAQNCFVYQSIGSNWKREVLFTGYYEPTLLGSLTQSDEYRHPVYAMPSDLIRIDLSPFSDRFAGESIVGRYTGSSVVPYYDRRQIEQPNSPISQSSQILAWVKDPIDLFFLQIQGSGRLLLPNGDHLNLHYHASNGHPYRSIGKLLIDEGKIAKEHMSMQAIRAYLNENPEEQNRILNHNPSDVFFKTEIDGPIGYLQEPLTPERSVATDRRLFPPGALGYIETVRPVVTPSGQIDTWKDFNAFILNQDTGGAIRGPGRVDLFWGNGPYAELAAGHMQHPGTIYFIVLKPDGA